MRIRYIKLTFKLQFIERILTRIRKNRMGMFEIVRLHPQAECKFMDFWHRQFPFEKLWKGNIISIARRI